MPDQPSAVPPAPAMPEPPTWQEITANRVYRLATLAFEPPSFDLCHDLCRWLPLIEMDDIPAPIVAPDGRSRPALKWDRKNQAVIVVMTSRGAEVKAYAGNSSVLSVFYPSGPDDLPCEAEEKRGVVRLRLALKWLYKRRPYDGECCGR
jgi:hypothetical protein